jgi:predicted Zn-dependent protease
MRRACSRRRSRVGPVGALLSVLLAACGPISLIEEQRLGYQFEQQMRGELPLVHDRVINEYVRDMGEDILSAAGPQPFDYKFFVVEDHDINAFAGPAGNIYVNTETILRARNASELAGVLAHEVGHVAERHIAENYNRQRNTKIGTDIVTAAAGIVGGGMMANAASLGGGLAAMAYLNSFGREAEMEADDFAVSVLPRAGYDPTGLVTFFKLLQNEQEGGGGVPSFLSSHPATEDRIQSTGEAIAALPPTPGLKVDDGGKLEIIQRRILLLDRSRRR